MRKIGIISKIVALAFFCLGTFTACDDHDFVDTNIHPGHILCSDGSLLSEETYYSQDRTKAVAVVFSDVREDGSYLAVMLKEGDRLAFCDTLSMELGTSCSLDAYDGFVNTTAMQNSYNVRTMHGSPLAMDVFHRHIFGQSDFVPSVAEARLLYTNRHKVNAVLQNLVAHGHDASLLDTSGDYGAWYWTSTEVAGNSANQAWLFSMATEVIHETPKTELHPYRAVVCVHYYGN